MDTDVYIEPSKRDTRYYIWNQRIYLCRIRYMDTRTVDDLREFGMPTSGDSFYDREISNEIVQRMLTIAEMEDYFNRGIDVSVVTPSDTKRIYEAVSNHLVAWKNHLQISLNVKDPDIDGLVRLDVFANAIYAHAKRHFSTDVVDSIMARMVSNQSQSRESILALRKNAPLVSNPAIDDKDAKEEKTPGRDSMAKIFIGFRPSGKWR